MNGIVTSFPTTGDYYSSSTIKMDEKIEGVPEEIVMRFRAHQYTYIKEGDIIRVYGKIIQETLKFWQKDRIYLKADHIYNEILQCGF
ncbi:MAG: hypothetical protein HWN67_13140 [Candidatus Helarchaeota archaeon]|nr:hypothetical protein [Candidatus Helarchaeota archaeon]